jgi:hypothetical protein
MRVFGAGDAVFATSAVDGSRTLATEAGPKAASCGAQMASGPVHVGCGLHGTRLDPSSVRLPHLSWVRWSGPCGTLPLLRSSTLSQDGNTGLDSVHQASATALPLSTVGMRAPAAGLADVEMDLHLNGVKLEHDVKLELAPDLAPVLPESKVRALRVMLNPIRVAFNFEG